MGVVMPLRHQKSHVLRDWTIYCGLFLSTLSVGMITVAIKPISTIFHVSLPVSGLIVTFYLFAIIAMLVPSGWLGDRFGGDRILAVGFATFGGSSFVCGISSTIVQLTLGCALQGVGAALIQGNTLGYIAKNPPNRRLHLSMMMTVAISMGPLLGPSLGAGVMEAFGWSWLFFINIPFCLLGLLIAWCGRDLAVESPSNAIDFKEVGLFVLLIVSAAWVLYAISTEASVQIIAVSAVLMLVTAMRFARYEWRQQYPLIPIVALMTRRMPVFITAGAFSFGYTAGIFSVGVPIALLNSGKTLSMIGIMVSVAPAGLFIGAVMRRYMIARFSDHRVMQAGLLAMSVAFLLFIVPAVTTRTIFFVVFAGIYGIGGGVFQVSNIKCAPLIVPDRPSTVGALVRLFQNLGFALGAAVTLHLLQRVGEIPTSGSIGALVLLWGNAAVVLFALFVFSFFQEKTVSIANHK